MNAPAVGAGFHAGVTKEMILSWPTLRPAMSLVANPSRSQKG
jgi:hypothetical protein